MATTRTFSDMLNEHLDYRLLMESVVRRNYFLQKVKKDHNWKGGTIPVPFKGAGASSVCHGSLTAVGDVSENEFVRGTITTQKEIWGTMFFNSRDLMEHQTVEGQKKGIVNEQSFLQSFADQQRDFVNKMKDSISTILLRGNTFCLATADPTGNDGLITVDRPEYLELGQKVRVGDSDDDHVDGYVTAINVNTGVVKLEDARTSGTVLDFSSLLYTTAKGCALYLDDGEASANQFTGVAAQLLPAGVGVGSTNLFGQAKTAYPYLQALYQDGSAFTATTLLDDVFDFWLKVKRVGKGHPTDALMSYDTGGNILKLLEIGSGSYKHISTKASLYGWTEILIGGPKGVLKVVMINEMPDDLIYIMDWSGWKLHSNGGFRVHRDMDGKMYYTVRATTGYTYYTDICFFGELACFKPSHQGVIYDLAL